jgi:hypothetical protein
MSDLETFGSLILTPSVEDAAQGTLELWMPTYLRWLERLLGRPTGWLKEPRSYAVSSDFNHWPEDQLPAIQIMCPGLLERPIRDGTREYRATYDLCIGVYCSAGSRRDTQRLAKYYAGALRAILVQKGSLGNFAIGTVWLDENYDVRVSDKSQRTTATAELKFAVEVYGVVKALTGPLVVPSEPAEVPPNSPTVTDKTGRRISIVPEFLS